MDLTAILNPFGISEPAEFSELKGGHINSTFLAVCPEGRFVVQALNNSIFSEPDNIMHNISAVAALFSEQAADSILLPHYLSAGESMWVESDGAFWRVYEYIDCAPPTMPYNGCFLAGRAFGVFMRVAGSRKIKLRPALPGYHDFGAYFAKLNSAMASASMKKLDGAVINRLSSLNDTLAQVFTADFPKRVIHGDAKSDNIIIGSPSAVIDLDTVMDGYAALDFGDLVRSVCRGNDNDMSAVRDVARGFANGLEGALSGDEVHSLYYGILWSTGELAVRYLTDYLTQEGYFRDKSPAQCLSRANELLLLLSRFIAHGDEITELIYECFRNN